MNPAIPVTPSTESATPAIGGCVAPAPSACGTTVTVPAGATPVAGSCTAPAAGTVATAACTTPATAPAAVSTTAAPADKTLFELTAGADFTLLHAAIKAAGLKDKLKSSGPYTLFAPTDAAFEKLPAGALEKLMQPENKELLISALNNHILGGRVLGREIGNGRQARMLGGKSTQLSAYGEPGQWVDTLGTNGVMHPINRVVLPN